MEADFWLNKWEAEDIGFHREEVNPLIVKHFGALELTQGARVLVPLCGKTLDMLWLAKQGFKVVGVELSEIAARDFFEENNLDYHKSGITFVGEDITIICGDFFGIEASELGKVDAIFDRAATIALPPEMRANYLKKLATLMARPKGLMILM